VALNTITISLQGNSTINIFIHFCFFHNYIFCAGIMGITDTWSTISWDRRLPSGMACGWKRRGKKHISRVVFKFGTQWEGAVMIYNYLCNQYLSPLMLWVWISIRVRCTTWYDKVCHWIATGLWFSPGTLVSSTKKSWIYWLPFTRFVRQTDSIWNRAKNGYEI
jgi:hypothetical protein